MVVVENKEKILKKIKKQHLSLAKYIKKILKNAPTYENYINDTIIKNITNMEYYLKFKVNDKSPKFYFGGETLHLLNLQNNIIYI